MQIQRPGLNSGFGPKFGTAPMGGQQQGQQPNFAQAAPVDTGFRALQMAGAPPTPAPTPSPVVPVMPTLPGVVGNDSIMSQPMDHRILPPTAPSIAPQASAPFSPTTTNSSEGGGYSPAGVMTRDTGTTSTPFDQGSNMVPQAMQRGGAGAGMRGGFRALNQRAGFNQM